MVSGYNVGVSIIIYLFDVVWASMTSDIYVDMLNVIEAMVLLWKQWKLRLVLFTCVFYWA